MGKYIIKDKNEIVKKIKEKKELSGIAEKIIQDSLDSYLKKYNLSVPDLSNKEIKFLVKEIRSELRRLTGQYKIDFSKVSKEGKIDADKFLASHKSTSERKDFYPQLKKFISALKIKSILDLGCGLNPLALAEKGVEYYASDIDEKELAIIKKFFKQNKIKGKVFVCDIRKIKNDLPKTDLCLIFKVLEIVNKNLSEKILSTIPSKKILASFATKKLSGKRMTHPERSWFEKILERNNWKYEKIYSENEIFYYILK